MDKADSLCLTGENIDAASGRIEKFLTEASVDKRNVLRFRLMFEEILLNYRDRFGEEKKFTLLCTMRFSRPRVVISVTGESFVPFVGSGNDGEHSGELLRGMLETMGLAPSYRFKNGENIITLTPERKKRCSSAVRLLCAIAAAVIAGLLCSLLPEGVRGFLSGIIEPLSGTFMGLLSAISGPLIFLSVLWGIYSIGDVASFGRIGKRMIAGFMLMSAVLLLISCCIIVPFFSVELSGSGKTDFTELYQMLLDIVPSNFFRPFAEGNPLQIIFIAVIFGAAMLVLNDRTAAVANFAEQANNIVQFIMKCISAFIPVFIFISIFKMILGGNLGAVSGSLKLVLLMTAGQLAIMGVSAALIVIRRRISPLLLIKKLLPILIPLRFTARRTALEKRYVKAASQEMRFSSPQSCILISLQTRRRLLMRLWRKPDLTILI